MAMGRQQQSETMAKGAHWVGRPASSEQHDGATSGMAIRAMVLRRISAWDTGYVMGVSIEAGGAGEAAWSSTGAQPRFRPPPVNRQQLPILP
jgi:hypothetical protein